MRKIEDKGDGVYFVVSEPGDCTRYDYLVYRDGPDEFTFAPKRSTFPFPQRINYWNVQDFAISADPVELSEELVKEAGRRSINPWTFRECVVCVKEIWEAHE